MSALVRAWFVTGLGIGLLTVLCGCVAEGGDGYAGGGAVGVSYGVDFYEPYGYEYGGWGGRYRVGPPRGGERRPDHPHGAPAYHPAAPSRAMPSIPSRPRGH